jgi:hypothetical protein
MYVNVYLNILFFRFSNFQQFRPTDGFGLFGNSPPSQQPQQPQPSPLQERNYIDNLMCNWTSPGVGTYSPFGAVSAPERIPEIQIPQQKPLQPPAPLEEKVVPKKRMVAEVSEIDMLFI